jgi:tricorn protease
LKYFGYINTGPIVGERTLGILVNPATDHQLINGGGITVPSARLYLNDDPRFEKGAGVKPDFPI